MNRAVAVVGASGFVGSACASALEQAGFRVIRVRAPRLTTDDPHSAEAQSAATELAEMLRGAEAVVNCAGNPDASSGDYGSLVAANSVLPGVVGAAARQAGVPRYVHVSSAVVQGRRPVLDSTDSLDPFSPYARSKAAGEGTARSQGPALTTVYRPPSVHGPTRRVTRQLSQIARSPASTVARPGTAPTPQTHIDNVADALVLLATSATPPPGTVHHPWEGHTTADLLRLLGEGRCPRLIPRRMAHGILAAAGALARVLPRLQPYARRVEMTWFGQSQAPSWLTEQGWQPLTTEADWLALGHATRTNTSPASRKPHDD